MKIRNKIAKLIFMILAISAIIGTANNFVLADSGKELRIQYFRYVNGANTNGYALNTDGTHHPIYQILSSDNKTNFYCLNATISDTWNNNDGSLKTPVTYNGNNGEPYDLEEKKDVIANLPDSAYKNVANSNYYDQIIWLLNNFYIPGNDAEANLTTKRALLAKAGIAYTTVDDEDLNGNSTNQNGYRYVKNTYAFVSNKGKQGYFYYDTNSQYQAIEVPDELIESVQQSAIWYFTNYLDNNTSHSTTYNAYVEPSATNGINWLLSSNGTTNTNTNTWATLANLYKTDTDVQEYTADIGAWYQEIATILYDYLVESASAYRINLNESKALSITQTADVNEKTVNSTNYYVLGPITITDHETAPYTIGNAITVSDGTNTITGSYISDENGNRKSDQTVKNYVGASNSFYIAVPKAQVNGSNIQVDFDASYQTVEKLLWTAVGTEQPIVEVNPTSKPLPLQVKGTINKEFDLALRKRITRLVNSAGTIKAIVNENNNSAERSLSNIIATDIATNKTATYKHRKDPVVVEKGDVVTYSITVYNEGDKAGYADTIVDKLPAGLVPKAYAENRTTTGTLSGMTHIPVRDNIDGGMIASTYSYVYNATTNEITFTNVSKSRLSPYGEIRTDMLSSDTIEIECKVTQAPSATTNTYLTNIAYISKEHNLDDNIDITNQTGADRDSVPATHPTETQVTTGDTYDGYKGNGNQSVYNDTNNEYHYKGEQDDDDFEIIVIKPEEFDLALKKYIYDFYDPNWEVYSAVLRGRHIEEINTRQLAEGTATTATYTLDKTPILVKSGNYVTYKFQVFNEGKIDGYVKEITDHIPTGLQFVYADPTLGTNKLYAVDSQGVSTTLDVDSTTYNLVVNNNSYWTLNNTRDTYNNESTISIKCNVDSYLEETSQDKLLSAYVNDASAGYNGSGLDSVYVTAVFRVSAPNGKGTEIRNEAAITEAEDTVGNKQDDPTKSENDRLKDRDSQINQWPGKDGDKAYQDDEDYDRIILEKVDLALTKFIAAVSDDTSIVDGEYLTADKKKGSKTNPYDRETKVDSRALKAGTSTNATYTKTKNIEPLELEKGKYVVYDIRVYNEGETDVYAGEVADYLPNYLDYVDCDFNTNFGWHKDENNAKLIKTTYLGYNRGNNTDNLLKAFNKTTDDGAGSGMDYRDLQIVCQINGQTPAETKLVNSAEITKYEDKDGDNVPEDVDSKPENLKDEDKNKEERQQDDDDYEVVKVKPVVDLALTKFIAAISKDNKIENGEYLTPNKNVGSKTNPYDRATSVDTTELKARTKTTATYNRVKTPLEVEKESYVLYDIRVYNEGETDLYAGEVADYLPDYLDYVESEFNTNFGWHKDENDPKKITTTYLGYNNGNNTDNLLKAFNREVDEGHGEGLDYRDLQVLCKVNNNTPGETKLVNSAEITKYENKDGENIPKDVDSEPNNIEDKNKEERYQDDDDWEVVKVKPTVDLALTKFIAAVSDDVNIENGEYLTPNKNVGSKTNPYDRATSVDTSKLRNPDTDAIYNRVKTPLVVPAQSYVLYDIRVYNEGEVDVYAGRVTDYLPNYLDYVDCAYNTERGWHQESDGKTIYTEALGYNNGNNTDNLLKAFDKENDDGKGSGLDYRDLTIICRVNSNAPEETNLVNSAEITKYEDKDGKELQKDVDSEPDNIENKNKEERYQDDDDWEVVRIKKKIVDLALTKFIAAVSDDVNIENGEYLTPNKNVGSKTNPYDRATSVDTSKLRNPDTDAIYNRVKTPLVVPAQSYVLYDIRVYNEGEVDVYAGKVTDYLPDYLDYVSCEFNDKYGWSQASDGKTISTTYLGYNKGNNTANLLKAFDIENDDGKGSGLDYRDLQIICKVNDKAPTATNLVNSAEITKYEDKDGNDFTDDVDSRRDNIENKNREERYEDDDDWEVVLIKTFDLSLLKYVSTVYVTEDGKTTTTQTKNTGDDKTDIIPKVEINRKKLSSTIVKFGYTIKITNEGDIAGYAKEITDYVPNGLKFYSEDNSGWTEKGNNVITTRLLENTLLQPGESAQVTVIFRWENSANNLGQKTNIAEISEDYNEDGVPDRDSTPNNKVEGEDDIDDAAVLLSISTGLADNLVRYATIGLVISVIFATGIISIKKFVL